MTGGHEPVYIIRRKKKKLLRTGEFWRKMRRMKTGPDKSLLYWNGHLRFHEGQYQEANGLFSETVPVPKKINKALDPQLTLL